MDKLGMEPRPSDMHALPAAHAQATAVAEGTVNQIDFVSLTDSF
jgi:hypothetical protein